MDTYLVCYRRRYGRHSDPYCDFEESLLKNNNWVRKKESNKVFRKLFFLIILPLLKRKKLILNFKNKLYKEKILFGILSGAEFSKIYILFSNRAKLKVIYMFDPWPLLHNLNLMLFKSFRINIAFFPSKDAVEFFNNQNLENFKAYYIPEGVDSSKYKFIGYNEKNIDILQFGRKWEWLHNEIIEKCKINEIKYIFPENSINPLFPDRNDFVSALSQSKIIVCVPRTITNNEQVDGMERLTTRYFEAMSSKALIWGIAPKELIELFGYNPVVEIDMTNPFIQLIGLLKNYDDYIPLIEKNYYEVINNHQWKNRADDIKNYLENILKSF